MKRSAVTAALALAGCVLTNTTAMSASLERFPSEIERLIVAVDLDGFTSGKCLALLPDSDRARIEAGQRKFDERPPGTTAPLLDQVYYGAVGRGVIDAEREAPDAELCEMMRSDAAESLADKAAAIATFEASLPKELQREEEH
ncbi:MAG: hypothetical protein ACK4MY_09160 [Brevundimonas sp.]